MFAPRHELGVAVDHEKKNEKTKIRPTDPPANSSNRNELAKKEKLSGENIHNLIINSLNIN